MEEAERPVLGIFVESDNEIGDSWARGRGGRGMRLEEDVTLNPGKYGRCLTRLMNMTVRGREEVRKVETDRR